MEGIAKAKSSSRIPIRFWSQEALTHLPLARKVPFGNRPFFRAFSVFPITWGVCTSLDGQPNACFRWAFDTVLIGVGKQVDPKGARLLTIQGTFRRDNGRSDLCSCKILKISYIH